MSLEVGQVVRGKFVYRGGLTGGYYVANARKVRAIDGDKVSWEVVGQKWDVTEDVENLWRERLEEQKEVGPRD